MREIPLGAGRVAIVDDEDFAELSRFTWHYTAGRGPEKGYAARWVKAEGRPRQRRVYMHKQIVGAEHSQKVDHADRDSLNNRRKNLRPCTNAQNNANKVQPRAIVPYRGVQKLNRGGWQAKIRFGGRKHCLGSWPTPEEAARAYDDAARREHGPFAIVNFQAEAA